MLVVESPGDHLTEAAGAREKQEGGALREPTSQGGGVFLMAERRDGGGRDVHGRLHRKRGSRERLLWSGSAVCNSLYKVVYRKIPSKSLMTIVTLKCYAGRQGSPPRSWEILPQKSCNTGLRNCTQRASSVSLWRGIPIPLRAAGRGNLR